MYRHYSWALVQLILVTCSLLLSLPVQAQTTFIWVGTPDVDAFPQVKVKLNLPCSQLQDENGQSIIQLQEDYIPVEKFDSHFSPIASQTALLLDIWSNADSKIGPIREALSETIQNSPQSEHSGAPVDQLSIFGPKSAGLNVINVISWTVDGGMVVNNITGTLPAQGVTGLTSLISDTLMAFQVVTGTTDMLTNMIVFSDGTDPVKESRQQLNAVLEAVQRQNVVIHTVFVPDAYQDEAFLRQFSSATGGLTATLTTSSTLDLIWQSLRSQGAGCEVSYRSSQQHPKQLAILSRQFGRQTTSNVTEFPEMELPNLTISNFNLSPSDQIRSGETSNITFTYEISFDPLPDRGLRRIDYGIKDILERTLFSPTIPSGQVVIPTTNLPAGKQTLFFRASDELGITTELTKTIEVMPSSVAKTITTTNGATIEISSTDITVKEEPQSWIVRFAKQIEKWFESIKAINWRDLILWLLKVIAWALLIVAIFLWIRNRLRLWRKKEVQNDYSSRSTIDSQPVMAVLRFQRRNFYQTIPDVIPLNKSLTRIGRNSGMTDVELSDPDVGNDVFVIEKRAGEFYIASDNNTNDVRIQDKSLKELVETRLESGYIIGIGKLDFIFFVIHSTVPTTNGMGGE